jgi:ribosomal protein S18 acetylase RimI-like enzyme
MRPFSAKYYDLPRCSLRRLEKSAGGALGPILASMDPWRTLGFSPQGLSQYLCRPDSSLKRFRLVAQEQNIGVVCLRYPWLRGAYIELLAVFAPYQGEGLGREMMAWIVQQTALEADNLWVAVSSFNHRAQRFYQSFGFSQVAVLTDLVKDGYDELLLRRRLSVG